MGGNFSETAQNLTQLQLHVTSEPWRHTLKCMWANYLVSNSSFTLHLSHTSQDAAGPCHIRHKMLLVMRFKFSLYCYTITRWPLTLKTFTAMATDIMNNCATFHWNPSTKHRDIMSYFTTYFHARIFSIVSTRSYRVITHCSELNTPDKCAWYDK